MLNAAKAQQLFTGKVIDAKSRQPLEGAYIKQQDRENAVILTDNGGNFILETNADSVTLNISYIGYRMQTVRIAAKQYLKVEMQADALNLKDIIVSQNAGYNKFSSIARIDLDLKPVKNTQELLRLVPGLFVAQHAGGGKAEQIFLRGFDCDHGTDIQVSVDGMPVNMVSHAHGQGYADAHFIIPEIISNIDYGTGPYYAQQGNLNTAGYVNFVSFNNIPRSRIQVEAGRYNTFRTLAVVDLLKKNKDRQSAYIAGEFNYTNGPTINPQNFNRINLFGKYNLAISSNTQLTFSTSAFKSKWDASGQVPSRVVEANIIPRFGSIDPTEGGQTARYNANIIISHRFNSGADWQNQFWYSRYMFNLYSNFTFYLSDTLNGDEINQGERRNVYGYLSKLTYKKGVGNTTISGMYGVGTRYDATDSSKLAHVTKRQFLGYVKLGNIKELNVYAFMDQQLNYRQWQFDAGLRFDYLHFNYFDLLNPVQSPSRALPVISPKINIRYSVNKDLQFYVKAGRGFHSNDTRVVVANEGHDILPAAYGTDLGIVFKPAKKLLVNAALWYLYLQQEFVYVGDDGNIEPSGKTRRLGIDVIARYQFSKELFANINFNLTRSRALDAPKGADYIPLAPIATSTGGLSYKKQEGLNGGISYRYIRNRPANEDNTIVAKGYFLLDGTLNYTKPRYEIGLALENIANTKWNEAQFETTSRLKNEPAPITELNYTPGTPFSFRVKCAVFF